MNTVDYINIPRKDERTFFEGPRSRTAELFFIIKVMFEFIKGFRALHFVGPCVTVFGSARFDENHPYYIKSREVGKQISLLGFTVMTGGGPGVMEAANRGAKDVNGKSVGCNIQLPFEQKPNPYLDKWVNIKYFFVRKVLLFKYSYAFVVMPGGYGTLDELAEAITLIQTKMSPNFPVVIIGKEYYDELFEFFTEMKESKTIDDKDIDLIFYTDSVEEAMEYLKIHAIDKFNLTKSKTIKKFKWLGE